MDKKRSLLETFPHMAQVVAEYRRAFGNDVKILYMSENGQSVGHPSHQQAVIGNSNEQTIANKSI